MICPYWGDEWQSPQNELVPPSIKFISDGVMASFGIWAALKRDVAVAFSPRAQPVWFRVVKWILFIAITVRWHDSPYFWPGLGAAVCLGAPLHFFYRWKTRGWTRAWGGWNDPKFIQK